MGAAAPLRDEELMSCNLISWEKIKPSKAGQDENGNDQTGLTWT